ncbi:MAG: thiamine pyrophosphate-binding protein, partial [Candidatus Hydrothermarchaeaceae archaeon]
MRVARWRCTVCNWVYDDEVEGKAFKDLPDDYLCPVCSAPKSAFERVGASEETGVKTTVSDKIIEQLTAVGVTHIYGIPGESNLPLMEALRKQDKIKFILTRHEGTAAFMASAHGKITGRLGVCLSIAGPGATNLITGLVDAATDGAPVLALTGQVPQPFLGSEYLQEIDQIELFKAFAVYSETIARPSQALRLTTLAIKTAYSKRGVAHLSLPTDVLAESLEGGIWEPKEHIFYNPFVPPGSDIKKAAEVIDKSERPVILAGWGIRESVSDLTEFAEKISAPVAMTSRGKGAIFETHKLALGVLGVIGTPYAAMAIKEADLIIVLGSGFRQVNLVPSDVPIVQVDINGIRVGKSFPVEVGLVGDAKLTLRELLKIVKKKTPDTVFLENIGKLKSEHLKVVESDSKNMAVPIHPGFVIQAIKRNVEKNAIITVDVGDHTYWFYRGFISEGEETYLSSNMASMAFALPAALAAQIDFPERQVICVTGDGGFAMLMADFTTAVFNNLPINVVVFNDGRLKNIKKEQEAHGYAEFGTEFVNPNFAEFANSCGG